MGFDWKKYHEVGEHLKNYSEDEAYQRAAISRYYYAYFNIIRRYFEKRHYEIHSKYVHQKLIDELKNSLDDNEYQLSVYLKRFRGYRNNADYDDKFKARNIQKTQKLIKDMDKILSKLQ